MSESNVYRLEHPSNIYAQHDSAIFPETLNPSIEVIFSHPENIRSKQRGSMETLDGILGILESSVHPLNMPQKHAFANFDGMVPETEVRLMHPENM
jgi:hypothetical protein